MLSRLWKEPGCTPSRNWTAENGATEAEPLEPDAEGHTPDEEKPEVERLGPEADETMPELRLDVTVPAGSCV